MKVSIKRMAIRKSLSLYFTVLLTDIMHNEVTNVVRIINSIDIPSTPTL